MGFVIPFLFPALKGAGLLFAQFLANTAVSFGLNFLAQALRPKPLTGGELELRTGTQPAEVVFGLRATTGVLLTPTVGWERSNRKNERAYVLSAWRTTALKHARVDGEWRTLTAVTSVVPGVPEYRVNGVEGEVFIRFYRGHPDQAADPYMVANSDGDWKNTNYVAGCSYAIVRSRYHQEKLPTPAEVLFEIEGAPLYDPRKDTTVGGSGAHRINDWTTWEYSANPALMILALRIGLKWGDEMILGEGASASEIPFADYALAANICDENDGTGRKRYEAHTVARLDEGKTLADIMQPILVAMAGTYVPRIGGDTILAGAPRPVNHTIDDEHVAWGRSVRFTKFRDRINKFNVVGGTYSSPSDFYEQADYGERVLASELVDDGERLKTELVLEAVTDRKQAQELADIYLRQNAFGASLTLTLGSYHQLIRPGDRVQYTTTRWGGFTKTFIVTNAQPLGPEEAHAIELTMEEDSNTVFDASLFDAGRPPIIVPGNPSRQQELEGFVAAAVVVSGANGVTRPGFRFSWTAVDDPTVSGATIQWKPATAANWDNASSINIDEEASFVTVTEGVVANTLYDVRSYLLTTPRRVVNWSATTQVMSLAESRLPIDFDEFNPAIRDMIADMNETAERIENWDIDDVWNDLSADMAGAVTLHRMQANLGRASAQFVDDVKVVVDATGALAARVTTLEASLGSLNHASAVERMSAQIIELQDGAQAVADFTLQLKTVLQWNDVTGQSQALLTLDSRVTATENTNTSQSSLLASLQSQLTTLNGTVTGQGTAILNLQTQVTEIDGDVQAMADALIGIGAMNASGSATAWLNMSATTNPAANIPVRLSLGVRSTLSGSPVTGALALQVRNVGGTPESEVLLTANRTYIVSGGTTQAFFDDTGTYIRTAFIGELNANMITVGTLNAARIPVLNADKLSPGTITLVQLAAEEIYRYGAITLASTNTSANSSNFAVNNPRGNAVKFVIDYTISAQTGSTGSSATTTVRLVRLSDNAVLWSELVQGGTAGSSVTNTEEDQRTIFDLTAPSGTTNYRLEAVMGGGIGSNRNAEATAVVEWVRA